MRYARARKRFLLATRHSHSTIFYYMGEGVYNSFVDNDMDVYTADYNEYSIEDIYKKLTKKEIMQLTSTNFQELLNPGENEVCSCGCEPKK